MAILKEEVDELLAFMPYGALARQLTLQGLAVLPFVPLEPVVDFGLDGTLATVPTQWTFVVPFATAGSSECLLSVVLGGGAHAGALQDSAQWSSASCVEASPARTRASMRAGKSSESIVS